MALNCCTTREKNIIANEIFLKCCVDKKCSRCDPKNYKPVMYDPQNIPTTELAINDQVLSFDPTKGVCDRYIWKTFVGGGGGGGGCGVGDIFINQTIFVDPKYGNDLTGEVENMDKPFKTLAAALAEAPILPSVLGDPNKWTIYVRPGNYSETNLVLKNKVDWFFQLGSKLTNTSGITPLFTDSNVPVDCSITGWGNFEADVIFSLNNNSTIIFECDSITTASVGFNVGNINSFNISIYSIDYTGVLFQLSGNITTDIIFQSQNLNGVGCVVNILDTATGQMNLQSNIIICNNNNTPAFQSISNNFLFIVDVQSMTFNGAAQDFDYCISTSASPIGNVENKSFFNFQQFIITEGAIAKSSFSQVFINTEYLSCKIQTNTNISNFFDLNNGLLELRVNFFEYFFNTRIFSIIASNVVIYAQEIFEIFDFVSGFVSNGTQLFFLDNNSELNVFTDAIQTSNQICQVVNSKIFIKSNAININTNDITNIISITDSASFISVDGFTITESSSFVFNTFINLNNSESTFNIKNFEISINSSASALILNSNNSTTTFNGMSVKNNISNIDFFDITDGQFYCNIESMINNSQNLGNFIFNIHGNSNAIMDIGLAQTIFGTILISSDTSSINGKISNMITDNGVVINKLSSGVFELLFNEIAQIAESNNSLIIISGGSSSFTGNYININTVNNSVTGVFSLTSSTNTWRVNNILVDLCDVLFNIDDANTSIYFSTIQATAVVTTLFNCLQRAIVLAVGDTIKCNNGNNSTLLFSNGLAFTVLDRAVVNTQIANMYVNNIVSPLQVANVFYVNTNRTATLNIENLNVYEIQGINNTNCGAVFYILQGSINISGNVANLNNNSTIQSFATFLRAENAQTSVDLKIALVNINVCRFGFLLGTASLASQILGPNIIVMDINELFINEFTRNVILSMNIQSSCNIFGNSWKAINSTKGNNIAYNFRNNDVNKIIQYFLNVTNIYCESVETIVAYSDSISTFDFNCDVMIGKIILNYAIYCDREGNFIFNGGIFDVEFDVSNSLVTLFFASNLFSFKGFFKKMVSNAGIINCDSVKHVSLISNQIIGSCFIINGIGDCMFFEEVYEIFVKTNELYITNIGIVNDTTATNGITIKTLDILTSISANISANYSSFIATSGNILKGNAVYVNNRMNTSLNFSTIYCEECKHVFAFETMNTNAIINFDDLKTFNINEEGIYMIDAGNLTVNGGNVEFLSSNLVGPIHSLIGLYNLSIVPSVNFNGYFENIYSNYSVLVSNSTGNINFSAFNINSNKEDGFLFQNANEIFLKFNKMTCIIDENKTGILIDNNINKCIIEGKYFEMTSLDLGGGGIYFQSNSTDSLNEIYISTIVCRNFQDVITKKGNSKLTIKNDILHAINDVAFTGIGYHCFDDGTLVVNSGVVNFTANPDSSAFIYLEQDAQANFEGYFNKIVSSCLVLFVNNLGNVTFNSLYAINTDSNYNEHVVLITSNNLNILNFGGYMKSFGSCIASNNSSFRLSCSTLVTSDVFSIESNSNFNVITEESISNKDVEGTITIVPPNPNQLNVDAGVV